MRRTTPGCSGWSPPSSSRNGATLRGRRSLPADGARAHRRSMTTDTKTGMTIHEPDVCWNLLRSAQVGRLAVSIKEQPDIFPINFVVDHGTVVFRTAEGTKLAAAVLGRGVAF